MEGFDYQTLIGVMHKITALENPTPEQQEHLSTLMDVMACSWLQERKTLPVSLVEYDAIVIKALSIVTFYSKT